ncbi:MAG: hypothetical protein AAFP20_02355 [Cyanobacteria bacterium J06614_10]
MNGQTRFRTVAMPAGGGNTDVAEITSLLSAALIESNLSTLQKVQTLFGGNLPDDVAFQPAEVQIPALADMAFTTNYDEGYCGHFSIPHGNGAAAAFDKVMAQPDPMRFIKNNLNFGDYDNGEWILFMPGLNTLHKVKPGWEQETTTPQRLREQYQPVLGMQMAQMHLGTDMDQGEAVVPINSEAQSFLESQRSQLDAAGIMPRFENSQAIFGPRQRDRIESILSQYGFARPLFREHMVRLLKANETAQQPMVCLAYSRASTEICQALHDYIAATVQQRGESDKAEVERFLRDHLTVLTIGNAIRTWPDGPAYIHFSAQSDRSEGGTDPLTSQLGVHAGAPAGAGQDAIFLHTDGIFSGFDAHNFGAVGAATLRLIMDMNHLTKYRTLWERGRSETLNIPNYDQIAAKIVLTNGQKWIWKNETAWKGVQLPYEEDARQLLASGSKFSTQTKA